MNTDDCALATLAAPPPGTSYSLVQRADGTVSIVQSTDTGPRHHLDRRARELAALGIDADDDALLDTRQCAEWLQVSPAWLEIGRGKGYGPPYVRMAPRSLRYRVSEVRAWLSARACRSTAEYAADARRIAGPGPKRRRNRDEATEKSKQRGRRRKTSMEAAD